MSVEIRVVGADEVEPWVKAMRLTYLMNVGGGPGPEAIELIRQTWAPGRHWGAFDDGRCVATLRTFATSLTVPGSASTNTVATDSLTAVTVAATHRRQGILTRMLDQSLAEARERGDVVSILRAAEWPIYGRFGYAPASWAANFKVLSARNPSLSPPDHPIRLRQVDPAQLFTIGPSVHEQIRRQSHGQTTPMPGYWERELGLRGIPPIGGREPNCIVAEDAAGHAVGYLTWIGKDGGDWFEEPVGIVVREFLSSNLDAYKAMWGYLLNMDLVKTIEINERPVDEPLPWLLSDGRVLKPVWIADDVWLRILDLPAALSARHYQCADRIVLEVIDRESGGWAAGRYTLDGGPDGAQCTATPKATVDLRLSQRALAALYLSGNSVWTQRAAGLIDEQTPGACDRLQSMLFQSREPWNAFPF